MVVHSLFKISCNCKKAMLLSFAFFCALLFLLQLAVHTEENKHTYFLFNININNKAKEKLFSAKM